MMNMERHVRLFVTVQAASLALRAVAPPNETASSFPLWALVELLALRCYPAFPVRVQLAALVPHWVVRSDDSPMLQFSGLAD